MGARGRGEPQSNEAVDALLARADRERAPARPGRTARAVRAPSAGATSIVAALVLSFGAFASRTAVADPGRGQIPTCSSGSPERRAAVALLDALDRAVRAAAPSGRETDAAPLRSAFQALVQARCFELLATSTRLPQVRSTVSLRAWWDGGGLEFLRAALGDGGPDDRAAARPPLTLAFAPDERHALTADSVPPTHPLARVLCAAADATCGLETPAWRARAEQRMAALVAELARQDAATSPDVSPERVRAGCPARARQLLAPEQLQDWRSCVESTRGTETLPPLGSFRFPDRGRLTLRVRPDPSARCDEVRTYDLATGAARVARQCAPPRRAPSVPVAELREAALAVMLAPEAEHGLATRLDRVTLPADIPRSWQPSSTLRGQMVGIAHAASGAQVRLSWTWVDRGVTRASGTLPWPSSYDAAERYAAELLQGLAR